MLRAHPEYRLALLGGALVLVLLVGAVAWAVVARPWQASAPVARATAPPAAGSGLGSGSAPAATPAPSATTDPALLAAIAAGDSFALAYVRYDYRSGPPTGDAVKPYSTPRLFWQVTQGGQDTAGNPAPWTAITIGSQEVVTASVVSSGGQLAGSGNAAVQVVVSEHDTSSGGSWSGRQQEDLGLVLSGGAWLVDQVSQVPPQQ